MYGSRQVGKTYLLKELFASEYNNYVYIDLKKDDEARNFFKTTVDPIKYLNFIKLFYRNDVDENTLLIFDEVQECLNFITSLKYFCQDFRKQPVIITGNMVKMALMKEKDNDDSKFMFPVGKIEELQLYPMTFEEYLINSNLELYKEIKNFYELNEIIPSYIHEKAIEELFNYLVIGGMPETVDIFLKTKSLVEATNNSKNIFNDYLKDMSSYNLSEISILRTRNVFSQVFSQLNKPLKNFKVSQIEKNKKNRDFEFAFEWLENTGLIYRSYLLKRNYYFTFYKF